MQTDTNVLLLEQFPIWLNSVVSNPQPVFVDSMQLFLSQPAVFVALYNHVCAFSCSPLYGALLFVYNS